MKTIKDFTKMVKEGKHFTYTKQGDGEILCMLGEMGNNCDGHPYSKELGEKLSKAYTYLNQLPNSYISKWTVFDIPGNYVHSKGNVDGNVFLHKEVSQEKLEFFKTLKDSPKKKVYVGPEKLRPVIPFLNINEYVEVPEKNSFSFDFTIEPEDDSIYLFSAGMAAKPWIAELLQKNPKITCIDIGSGLDPIFVGKTRDGQLDQTTLRDFYQLNRGIPRRIISMWVGPHMPGVVKEYILTHELLGYEHVWIDNDTEIDEEFKTRYFDECFAAGRWGKLSDYLRMKYLEKYGGIYLDADVKVLKNFDDVLDNEMFVCEEKNYFLANSVIGSVAHHPVLQDYIGKLERNYHGGGELVFQPGMGLWTDVIRYSPDLHKVKIYPEDWFLPYNHQSGKLNITDNSHTVHYYLKSWQK